MTFDVGDLGEIGWNWPSKAKVPLYNSHPSESWDSGVPVSNGEYLWLAPNTSVIIMSKSVRKYVHVLTILGSGFVNEAFIQQFPDTSQ